MVPSHSLYHPVLDIAKLMVVTKHDAAVAAARSQEAAAESSQEAEVQQTQPRKEDQQDAKSVKPNTAARISTAEGPVSVVKAKHQVVVAAEARDCKQWGMCRRRVVQVRKEASKEGELLRKERKQC